MSDICAKNAHFFSDCKEMYKRSCCAILNDFRQQKSYNPDLVEELQERANAMERALFRSREVGYKILNCTDIKEAHELVLQRWPILALGGGVFHGPRRKDGTY